MLPKEDLLKPSENRDCLKRLLDQAEQAIKTWETVVSQFLSPPERMEAEAVFQRLTDVHILPWGGYPQAERQRLAIARSDLPLDSSQIPLALVEVAGNFMFDPATHRDFLGSVLGTGLERHKIGDILLLGERGAQIIVAPDLVEFLTLTLTQVRSVPVKTQPLDWEQLKVRAPQKKELTTVEASLRLDAVASAGFGMSRSKMVDLISAGDVRVNWKPMTQASHALKAGDLVAIRGKGRLEIGEVAITKKERYRINLIRYV
ncbi:MAG: photosystem II S4 domain protein [Nodosilinea sp.]